MKRWELGPFGMCETPCGPYIYFGDVATLERDLATAQEQASAWYRHWCGAVEREKTHSSDLFEQKEQLRHERDTLLERVKVLTEALLSVALIKHTQAHGPCWCDTSSHYYCVGQPQCEAARTALASAKETPCS